MKQRSNIIKVQITYGSFGLSRSAPFGKSVITHDIILIPNQGVFMVKIASPLKMKLVPIDKELLTSDIIECIKEDPMQQIEPLSFFYEETICTLTELRQKNTNITWFVITAKDAQVYIFYFQNTFHVAGYVEGLKNNLKVLLVEEEDFNEVLSEMLCSTTNNTHIEIS